MNGNRRTSSNHLSTRPVTTLLARLDGVHRVAPGRWRAMCPAHDGHRPALGITETDEGVVLMHCFAGCSVTEIAESLDLNLAELFPRDDHTLHHASPARRRFVDAQMWPALTLELLEVAVIIGAILRRGSVTKSEHTRLLGSLKRILDAEKYCHD
ncbi:hypothetical protein [Caballeronia sp. TF1N1]|uniref:hypothetical protein n=1 Tax=Caballeronia sp. TF1N1 TaxID=2878153 RepID=UPI001FD23FE5|nr:hypothetical protein [Caballeronia sp. TF1N1]